MPLVLQDPHVDRVIEFLRMQSGGVALTQIQRQFTPPLASRTAHRLVTNLVALGALTATGGTRYRRYHLRTKPGVFGTVTWFHPDSEAAAAMALRTTTDAGKSKRAGEPGARPTAPKGAAVVPAANPTGSVPDLRESASALPTTPTIPAERVQPLLDRVLPNFLSHSITPDRVLSETRMPAVSAFVLKPGEAAEDAATVITAALDQLTADDAAKYGCDAAAFARWREIFWPAGYALQPKPPLAPLPPLPLPKPMAPDRLALFLREVQYVVTKCLKPEAVRPYLERQKGWLRGTETVDDWAVVLTAELNRLRLEDAVARHIRPEQYRLWRKVAWPAPAP